MQLAPVQTEKMICKIARISRLFNHTVPKPVNIIYSVLLSRQSNIQSKTGRFNGVMTFDNNPEQPNN